MTDEKHDFDFLVEWSSLPDDELRGLYSDERKQILHRILHELGSDEELSTSVSAENFLYLVRRLREMKRKGSRALGDIIIEAAALMEEGQFERAMAVYRQFLGSSPSRFYRRIVTDLLNGLSDKP